MGLNSAFDGIIEEKLLNLHTAFIGQVVSVQSSKMCSVKPLDKIKAYGKNAKSQAVITRVPVLNHVRHYTLLESEGRLRVEPIKAGDLVLCVCAERDISSSSKGVSATPPVGHHQIGNAVVVGLLGEWSHE